MSDSNIYDQLRAKLQKWAKSKEGKNSKWLEYFLLLPDFLYLLCALTLDPDIPAKHKAKLGIVIAYIVSPLDLIPEGLIGPAGYAEDVALAAYVINQLVNHVEEKTILKHWKGSGDLLRIVRHVVEVADEMVGSGLWKKIKGMFSSK